MSILQSHLHRLSASRGEGTAQDQTWGRQPPGVGMLPTSVSAVQGRVEPGELWQLREAVAPPEKGFKCVAFEATGGICSEMVELPAPAVRDRKGTLLTGYSCPLHFAGPSLWDDHTGHTKIGKGA